MFSARQQERQWQGTPCEGVEIASLFSAPDGGGTNLLRMAQGAVFPRHRHIGREEVYVLEGRVKLGDVTLGPGDYLLVTPGEEHDGLALEAAVMLVVTDKGIEFV